MSRSNCPHCSNLLTDPVGPPNARILLLGEYPGLEEIKNGIPFTGPSGDILNSELARVGIQMKACRATYLWGHTKNEKGCILSWHVDRAVAEMKGKRFVLAMGSESSMALVSKPVMTISGIKFSIPEIGKGTTIIFAPSPGMLPHTPIGEFRLAVEKLAEYANAR